jgi:acetyltransferase-like isoleucine patch superfamily enzyme
MNLRSLFMRANAKYNKWMRSALQAELEEQLLSCGKYLYFEDIYTAKILFPRKLSFGTGVGFNMYPFVNAMGGVTIGDDTRFGPFVMIHSGDHRFDDLSKPISHFPNKLEAVRIGSDVWVGGHVSILRGSTIPDHCVIGAGTVVNRRLSLCPYDIVCGSPATVVGNRLEKYGRVALAQDGK